MTGSLFNPPQVPDVGASSGVREILCQPKNNNNDKRIVVIPFSEACRWNSRRLWINIVFNIWRFVDGMDKSCI